MDMIGNETYGKGGIMFTKVQLFYILILLIFLLIVVIDSTRLKIKQYSIASKKVTGNIRIALITDLHSCYYGENQRVLINAINDQNPDIVLMGGDICDDKIPNDNTELLLKGIADRYPCFYVTGNHEYWSRDMKAILNLFKAYDVNILEGTYHTIEVKGQTLNICGISDPVATIHTNKEFGVEQQLKSLEHVHKNGYYTVLLTHRPEAIQQYKQYHFDLVLAGHAHGGQWRIPGILNGLYAPNQGLFPKYAGGKYTCGNTLMIVSRGLARENTFVPRIFNRPELVIVNLLQES